MNSPLRSLVLASVVAVGVLYAAPALAIDCGSHLVTTGDSTVYVRSVCGNPVSTRIETHARSVGVVGYGGTPGAAQREVWIFDFGPGRFMEEVVFVNGVVQSFRTLGPGSSRGAPPQG